MKFGIMTYFNPLDPTQDQNLEILKSKMADGCPFEQELSSS